MKLTSKKKQEIVFLLIAQSLLREYLISLTTKEVAIFSVLSALEQSLHHKLRPYSRLLIGFGNLANKMIDKATDNKEEEIYIPLFVASMISIWNESNKTVFSQDLVNGVFSYYENRLDNKEVSHNMILAEKTYNSVMEGIR